MCAFYLGMANLKLANVDHLALNLQSFCLYFLSAETIGVCYHIQHEPDFSRSSESLTLGILGKAIVMIQTVKTYAE